MALDGEAPSVGSNSRSRPAFIRFFRPLASGLELPTGATPAAAGLIFPTHQTTDVRWAGPSCLSHGLSPTPVEPPKPDPEPLYPSD